MPRFVPFVVTIAAAGALATAVHATSDRVFLEQALEGDNAEVAMGKMAETKATAPGVRDFGRMLETDHQAAKAKALPVAQAHGVTDTTALPPEAKAEARKLRGLSGAAFDKEFVRYMVEDHQKDIADFEKQSRNGDSATAALARETLPDLNKHLQMAQQLSR